jgi:hypothetical protein
LGRGGRIVLDRLAVPEARGDPARLEGGPARPAGDPARLMGDPARPMGSQLGSCIIRPVTPPHLQLEDWDPYMVGR